MDCSVTRDIRLYGVLRDLESGHIYVEESRSLGGEPPSVALIVSLKTVHLQHNISHSLTGAIVNEISCHFSCHWF